MLADGPYAYLTLGDGGGNVAQDLSGNGRNGVYVGAPLLTNDGPFGAGSSALTIGASGQYVDMNATLVPTTGNWTVEAWVYSSGAGFGDGSPVWSQYHNTFSRRTSAQVQPSTGAVGMQIGSSSAWPVNQVSTDSWTHVAWRRFGSTVSIHANGQVVGSFSTGTNVDSKETWIGAHQGQYSTAYFNGRLAEVAVYRTALSDAQIDAHHAAAVPDVPVGPGTPSSYVQSVLADAPHAYLPLDETSGSVATDLSGAGRDGTVVGPVQRGTEGPFGPGSRSVTFTGADQRVQLAEALVPATGDWTVEAWVSVHGPGFGDGNPIWSQYFDVQANRTSAQASGTTSPFGVGIGVGESKGFPTGQLVQDEWSHVVWRKTDTVVQILVDGEVAGMVPEFGAIDTKDTWIGAHHKSGFSTAGFNGRISQFAVYHRALTNAELGSHWTAAGNAAFEGFGGGPAGDQLAALQAWTAAVAESCPPPPENVVSLEVVLDVVAGVCSISGVAETCQWVQFFCDHRDQLIVGIAATAVVLLAAPLAAAAGSSLATAWSGLSGWNLTLTVPTLSSLFGTGSGGTGIMVASGTVLTVTGADLVLTGSAVAIPLTIANVQPWLLNYASNNGPTGGSEDGDLGDDWTPRPASEIPGSDDCYQCANDIVQRLGGGTQHTLSPSPGTHAEWLPHYRGYFARWTNHKVVVYKGRVYDAFGPRTGEPIDVWKAHWDGFDEGIIYWGGL